MTGLLKRAATGLKASANLARGNQSRGMASSGGVNFWEKPQDPSSWIPEQAVALIVAGWVGLGMFLTRGDGSDPMESVLEARYQALKEDKPMPGSEPKGGHH